MRAAARVLLAVALTGLQPRGLAGLQPRRLAGSQASSVIASSLTPQAPSLQSDLDRIFADPVLSRALVAVRVESLRDGQVLYVHDDTKLVMPASNMKLLTMAVAAERLGWDFTYETRLEAAGTIADGTLHGDLIVVGGGDPSIGSTGLEPAPLFSVWADALARAGIRRVDGRLIGDDSCFDDEGLGAGWAWDYLGAGYAARSSGLSYNENEVEIRIRPGQTAGELAAIAVGPPGHLLQIVNDARTGAPGSAVNLDLLRFPGRPQLTIRGTVPAGGNETARSASVENPTKFFVEALRLALATRGIRLSGGAWDLDELPGPAPAGDRRLIARATSLPLASIAAYFLKASQNFYAETVLKTLGRSVKRAGTADAGRAVVRETLEAWGVPADAFVMYDGSGLSRYNYVTADTMVRILKHMWQDPRLRGPFAAALPVAAHDGTLDTRMKGTILDGRVEAKTGTISNVRSLSGYLETRSGERIVFSMIANHFTAPSSQVDVVVEKALARLAER